MHHTVYRAERWNGFMPQDMVAVEFTRPYTIGASELDTFIQALKQAFLPIGMLASLVRVAVDTRRWDKEPFSRWVHAHIKLSPIALTLTYEELVSRRLTWFSWGPTQSQLFYQDLHLRCYHDYALRRPDRCEGPSYRPLIGPVGETTISSNDPASEATTSKRKHSSSR